MGNQKAMAIAEELKKAADSLPCVCDDRYICPAHLVRELAEDLVSALESKGAKPRACACMVALPRDTVRLSDWDGNGPGLVMSSGCQLHGESEDEDSSEG